MIEDDDGYVKDPDFIKGGRSKSVNLRSKIVRDQVRIFGKLLATQNEMADHFGCCIATIENYMQLPNEDKGVEESEFSRLYRHSASKGKTSLRRVQMEKALGGDNTLLIWLGKQVLDQKDKIEEKIDTTQRIVVIDSDDAKL